MIVKNGIILLYEVGPHCLDKYYQAIMEIFTLQTVFVHIADLIDLKNMKEYAITMITVA